MVIELVLKDLSEFNGRAELRSRPIADDLSQRLYIAAALIGSAVTVVEGAGPGATRMNLGL